jgi:nicotinamidase-related amidase
MKVLLVVDVQNDFVTGALANPEAQKCIPRIKEKIQQRLDEGWKVMFTQDTHDEDYLDSSEGKYLPVVHCVNWTWGWQIVDELKEFIEPHSTIIKKRFGLNDLDRQIYLNMPGSWSFAQDPITEIELIGFCTDICVVSNAMLIKTILYDLNRVNISIINDCCAGVTPEKHNAALEVMKSCQINVI